MTEKQVVLLQAPIDQPKGYLEIVGIYGAEGPNPSIPVSGLPGASHLQISSWIKDSEFPELRSLNPQILFTGRF